MSFRIVDMHEKGKGVIATRALAENDVILVEKPLLTRNAGVSEWALSSELDAQFSILTDEDKASIMSLHDAHASLGAPKSLLGIYFTNAVGSGTPSDIAAAAGGVCPLISRVNHSCKPNAVKAYRQCEDTCALVASRSIDVGEEISISYCDIRAGRAERAQRLASTWRMTCTCEVCVEASPSSEVARQELRRLEGRLSCGDAAEPVNPSKFMKTLERLQQLYRTEELLNPAIKGRLADEMLETTLMLAGVEPDKHPRLSVQRLAQTCYESYLALYGPADDSTVKAWEWVRKAMSDTKYKQWKTDFLLFQMHMGTPPDPLPGKVRVVDGTDVVLRRLQKAPHLNGQQGVVIGFTAETNRYHIGDLPGGEVVKVKPENFVQMVHLKCKDPSECGADGSSATSLFASTYDCNEEAGTYVVKVHGSYNESSHVYTPVNAIAQEATRTVHAAEHVYFPMCGSARVAEWQPIVRVYGLSSDTGRMLNNTHGRLVAEDGDRCIVDFGSGKRLKVKKTNLSF